MSFIGYRRQLNLKLEFVNATNWQKIFLGKQSKLPGALEETTGTISALENSQLAEMVPTSVEEQDDSSEHLVTRESAVVRVHHLPLSAMPVGMRMLN